MKDVTRCVNEDCESKTDCCWFVSSKITELFTISSLANFKDECNKNNNYRYFSPKDIVNIN